LDMLMSVTQKSTDLIYIAAGAWYHTIMHQFNV